MKKRLSDEQGDLRYTGDWASTRQEERAAFERFMDFDRRRRGGSVAHKPILSPHAPAGGCVGAIFLSLTRRRGGT